MTPEITDILASFKSLKLEEMEKVKLMDRYDTKFVLPVSHVPALLESMRYKYNVLEINGLRISTYNTVYLDTHDYMFFNQHITGRNGRVKIRYRNYISTGVTFLEIKKKTKKNKTVKWRTENILSENKFDEYAVKFISKHLPLNTEELKPVLVNSFNRITFASYDPPERITIDLDLAFSMPDGNEKKLPLVAIIELKCEGLGSRSPFSLLAKELSLYPTGFSKYCIGNAIIYDLPRKNILKPKLLLINRIENEYNGSIGA
jgi:hypothetical protein